MIVSEKDRLSLAKALHDIHRRDPSLKKRVCKWDKVSPENKKFYFFVAAALIENPPLEIRKAVRSIEGM